MSYAQINYHQRLGTGPNTVTLAAAGCFVTSFSNLLERFGTAADPATLNQFFIDRGLYIFESDGTRDLLAFSTITAFDGNVRITAQGRGAPTSDNSIVKFVFDGGKTHFSVVASVANRTIIDSWDGATKSWDAYGGPVEYATYTNTAAREGTTAKAQARYTVVETYSPAKQVRLNKQPTQLWGMNYAFEYMVNNPVESHNADELWMVTNKVHHEDGYDYYRREGQIDGFNVLDCDDLGSPAPTPAPAAVVPSVPAPPKVYTENVVDGITYTAFEGQPKLMYISKPGGAEKWLFGGVNNWRDFKSVQHVDYGAEVFIVGKALHPIKPTGALYYMVDADFGNFKQTGTVSNQYGFNKVDLSETKPPVLNAPAPAPVPVPAPVVAAPTTWRDSYQPYNRPVHLISTRDQVVSDLDNPSGPTLPLPKYNATSGRRLGIVAAYGTVTKDGVDYYRLKAETDTSFERWYCVPKIDLVTHTPNLLVAPGETTAPVSRATVVKDAMVLAKSHIEIETPKFLDDIIPKFLRNKKKRI